MFDLLSEISELIYLSDPITYELLYVNDAGKKFFHLTNLEGVKCYQALQGRDTPCPFCTNERLNQNEIYSWHYTNPLTGRHYLLKDRLVEWKGRTARMEIAFDLTESENEKLMLQNTLESQNVILECVRTLYQDNDLDRSIASVLKQLGSFLEADRSYIFDIKGDKMSNTYEWCAQGVVPQIDHLKDMDASLIDIWRPSFLKHQCVICEDITPINETDPGAYEVLRSQDIQSIVVAGLEHNGKLVGYLGVDNPPPEKIKNIAPLLHTLCYFIMLAMQRSQDEKLLVQMSYQDTLTGLFNRNRYMEDLEKLESRSAVGVVYLDVNGLKDLNDLHGHGQGDQLLIECARIMGEVFDQGTHYRIGGDEFVIVLHPIQQEQFEQKVQKLKRVFRSSEHCHPAIGSKWTAKVENIHSLMSEADDKMYEDKKAYYYQYAKSNRYRHYNDECLKLQDAAYLKQMIAQNRFAVYLQPKVCLKDKQIVGAEALVRFYAEDRHLIYPTDFLPLLEDAGLISIIDFFVFGTVCKWLAGRKGLASRIVPISVNFSRLTLMKPHLSAQLEAMCAKYQIPKSLIEIEITESVDCINEINLRQLISNIRSLGFLVSIDDFGTDYANLKLLSSIDFDELKLERSLIANVAEPQRMQTVLRGLVEICTQLDVQIVAEGVETQAQCAALAELGIHTVQGYFFGHPVPLPRVEDQIEILLTDPKVKK